MEKETLKPTDDPWFAREGGQCLCMSFISNFDWRCAKPFRGHVFWMHWLTMFPKLQVPLHCALPRLIYVDLYLDSEDDEEEDGSSRPRPSLVG